MGAEKAVAEDAEAKSLLGPDNARAGEGPSQDVGTEDVGTEDVVTEDGSFDILGSLSTSLNQQAEDDVPPPSLDVPPSSLPEGPAETVASEPAQPAQPDETATAAPADETGLSAQTGETVKTEPAEETGEASKTGEAVQTDQTSEIKEGGEAQTQELPKKAEEEI